MGEDPSRRAKHRFAYDSILSFNLPSDISLYVFLKLPVKSILRCRCVCKQWLRLLSDPDFARMHLNHSSNPQKLLLRSYFQSFHSVDYEESKGNCDVVVRNFPLESLWNSRILGSCNGLVCIAIDHKKEALVKYCRLVLWNPSTGDYKILPDANPVIDADCGYTKNQLVGLGYDSLFGDYKLVRVIFPPQYRATVYSLKTNSWKVIESTWLSRFGFTPNVVGTAVNGSIYWLMDDRWIVGFDFKEDKFIELQLIAPWPFDRDRLHYCINLMVMGGCLGVYYWNRNVGLLLWMMKEDKKDEWTKLTAIPNDELGSTSLRKQPLCVFENEKVLIYVSESTSKIPCVELLVYDLEVNSIVKTIPFDRISNCHDLVTYTESLVSPNAWVA